MEGGKKLWVWGLGGPGPCQDTVSLGNAHKILIPSRFQPVQIYPEGFCRQHKGGKSSYFSLISPGTLRHWLVWVWGINKSSSKLPFPPIIFRCRVCTANLFLYYDIPNVWERDYERRVRKWDTAIFITLPVKMNVLQYIAHSFDVMKKISYLKYMQRVYLVFGGFFVSTITQSFTLPIPCLFSCLFLPSSRTPSTSKQALVTPWSLHGAPQPLTDATPFAHWAWTKWLLWLWRHSWVSITNHFQI